MNLLNLRRYCNKLRFVGMKREYRLNELFDLQMGKTPARKNPEYWNSEDHKWISIADLSNCGKYIVDTKEYISDRAVEESGISLIPKNTVIMSFKLSIGKTAITSEPMYSNEAIMSFRDKHIIELLPDYLYYMFSGQDWEAGTNKAVMGKTLNKATLSGMYVKVHSIEEQRKIIAVLDKMKVVLDSRKEELEKLDELIKARFVEMFGMPGSDSRGWGLTTLGDCCEINPKKNKDSRLAPGLEVSFVPMPAVSENGVIDATDIRLYDEVKTGFTYFSENDVLFAKITPCMENGKGAVATKLHNGIGFGSTEFHVLRPYVGESDPYWIYYLTTFETFRQDAEKKMTGSAGQRRVPATFLKEYKTALPPIELQKRFANFVQQVDKSKVAVQKSLEKTQLLFNSLMQEYFG